MKDLQNLEWPALSYQPNLLDILFAHMPMGIAVFDRDLVLLRCNPTWVSFVERYAPPSVGPVVPGLRFFDLAPGNEASILPLIERVLAGETVRQDALRLENDGVVSYWDVMLTPLVEDGQVVGIMSASTDVTRRKQAEEALRKERNFISAVLDTAGALVVVLDREGRIVRFNQACEETTGYLSDEVRGEPLWDLFLIPEEVEPVKAVFEELRAGHFPNKYENYWVTKDRKRRLIAWSNTTILDADGSVEYVIGAGIDITERKQAEEALLKAHDELELRVKERTAELQRANESLREQVAERQQAEEALRESEEKFRGIVELANVGIAIVQDARFRFMNPHYASMLGYAVEEMLHTEFMGYSAPEERDRIVDLHTRRLRGEAVPSRYETVIRHKNGGRVYVDVSVGLVPYEGKAAAFVFLRDITEHKQAERALQERLAFEKLITSISTEFINLGPEEIDAGIMHTLEAIGRFADVDRSYVFLLSGDGTTMDNTHEWCAEGIEPQIQNLQAQPIETLPWSTARIKRLETVHIPRVADLPPEAKVDQEQMRGQDIQSLILVPMVYRGMAVGFLGFDSVRVEKTWSEDVIALLRIVGEIIANALEHRRAQAIQAGQRQFLELLATGGGFSETLHALVRIIEEQWPGMLGLILLVDKDGKHLHIGAAVSLPEEYTQSIEGLEIGPMVGSCGTACYRGERVIVEDIATDPRWDGLRDLGLKYGLRACWSEPVFSVSGQVIGTFAMYYRQPRAPTEAELRTIQMAAHLVGVAIEHKRAEETLQAAYQTLERRVEERTHELAALNAIAAVVSRSLDLKEIMSNALDKTLEVMGMDLGVAYRLEGSGDPSERPLLSVIAHRGISTELARQVDSLPLQGSMIEKAAAVEQPIVWQVTDYPNVVLRQAMEEERVRLGVSVPLLVKARLVGALVLAARDMHTFAPEELSLLAAVGQQIGVAVENAGLYEQAEQAAVITERNRLARELHDSVTQALYSVTLFAEAAAILLKDGKNLEAAGHLRELRDTAQEALREMRLLIFELRPLALEKTGLVAALQTRLEAVEMRGGIKAELQVEGAPNAERLPFAVQEELYHIAQEALNNVLRHARAQHVQVHLQFLDTAISLEVWDDGVGFEPERARERGGLGLRGMKERVQRIGGKLHIESTPGKGTKVTIEVPMSSEFPSKTQEF